LTFHDIFVVFCTQTPESYSNHFTQEKETSEEVPLESSSTDECSPNEKFNRGSTSIYIFDNNHKCVENVRKRSLLLSSQQCSGNAHLESDSSNGSEGDDDLVVASSELHPQTDKPENMKDDEVIVVVRKRGDKVFIEI